MTIEQMKGHLKGKWPNSNWAKKVEQMPDDQIVAIYMRLQRDKPPKPIHRPTVDHLYYAYECLDCKKIFYTDVPEQRECRYCSSPYIIITQLVERIEKA